MAGVAAGEEDIGAEASSMDPKETTEPGKVQRMSNVQKKKITLRTCFCGTYVVTRYTDTIFYGNSLTKSARPSRVRSMY